MRLSRLQRYTLATLIIGLSLIFITTQLSKFAQDISLSDWDQGAEGYVKASTAQVESGNQLALFFYTDWCSSCEEFRKSVLATSEVSEYFARLHPVKINPELGPAERQLANEFGVMGYPSFYIVDATTGKTKQIHHTFNVTPEQFIQKIKQTTL